MKYRTALVFLTIACAGGAVLAARAGQQQGGQTAPAPAGVAQAPTLTPEEIFEFQMKQDTAGAPEAGRPIYEKVCAACHRFGAIGRDVGPDLTTIASRFKKKDLLESILWPSKVISDQYKAEMFELKDGKILVGVVAREDALRVHLTTAESPERPVPVPKAQIAERAESTVSLMPEWLLEGYSQTDIANLLAFVLGTPPAQ